MSAVKQSIRQRQVELTRSAILDAARALFADQGYTSTTIEQIAGRAGVGVSTVYAVFKTKAAVLAEMRWRAVSAVQIPELERLVEPSASAPERIAAIVTRMRRLYETAGDVFAVQQAAAASDPALAENWAQAAKQRRAHMRRLLEPVGARLTLPLDRAADAFDALVGFELYDALVRRAGWSPAEYERWLASTLKGQLIK